MEQNKHTPDRIYTTGGPTSGSWNATPFTMRNLPTEDQYLLSTPTREAAPDLLDALIMFVDEYTELVNSGDAVVWHPEEDIKVIVARAAIAKARVQ